MNTPRFSVQLLQKTSSLLSCLFFVLLLGTFFTFATPSAHAAVCTFASTEVTNDFNNPANWAPCGVPTTGDDVIIPAATSTTMTADTLTGDVGSLTIAGTGTLNLGAYHLTVTGITTVDGTWNLGSGAATTTGNATVSASGTLNLGSGMLSVAGNLDLTTSVFTAGTGIVRFVGGGSPTITPSTNADPANTYFYNLESLKSGGTVTFSGTTSTVLGYFSATSTGATVFDFGSVDLGVVGTSAFSNNETVNFTDATVNFGVVTSTGVIDINTGNILFNSTLDNNGTIRLGTGYTTTTGNVTVAASGTLNMESAMLSVAGNLDLTTSVFTAGTGIVRFVGGGLAQVITPSTNADPANTYFYNLESLKSGGTVTFSGTTSTVLGYFSATSTGATAYDAGAVDLSIVGTVALGANDTLESLSTGNLFLQGSVTSTGAITLVTANVLFAGSLDNNGTVTLGSGSATTTGAVVNAGTINGSTATLNVIGNFSNSGPGVFNSDSGTVRFRSSFPLTTTIGIYDFNIVNFEYGRSYESGGNIVAASDLTVSAGSSLSLTGGRTLNVGGATVLNGALELAGSVATSTGALTVGAAGALTNITGTARLELGDNLLNLTGSPLNLSSIDLKLFGSGNQYLDSFMVNNMNVAMSGGFSALLTGSSTVLGMLQVTGSGQLSAEAQTLTIVGMTTIGSLGAVTSTTGTLNFGSEVTSTGAIGTLAGGQILFSGNLQNDGILDIGGTVTTTGNATSTGTIFGRTGTLVIMNQFANDGGSFNAQSGTVKYRGTDPAYTQMPSVMFNNLNIETGALVPFIWASTSTVLGNLTVAATANFADLGVGNGLTIVGNLTNNGIFSVYRSSATTSGNLVNTGTFYGGLSDGRFSLGGNLTAGTFDAQSGTFKFIGENAQSAEGVVYNNLVVSKDTGTVSLSASSTVLGTLVMNGANGILDAGNNNLTVIGTTDVSDLNSLTSNNGAMIFGDTVTLASGAIGSTLSSVGGDILFSGAVNNAGNLSVGTGITTSTLDLTNTGTVNGGTSGRLVLLANFITTGGTFNANTGTVKYRGDTTSGYRVLPAVLFNNLNIETTGTNGVDFSSSSSTVLGTLTIDSGAKMVDNTGTANTLTVVTALTNNGTFTNNDASVTSTGAFTNAGTFNGGTGTFSLEGNLVGAGTFTPQTSTFKFVGDAAQSAVSALYYNLIISKGLETVTMGSPSSTVLNALTMNGAGGTLAIGNNALTVVGAGNINAANTLSSTNGAISFGDTATIASTGALSSTGGDMLFSGTVNNAGTFSVGTAITTSTLTFTNTGTVNGGTGGTLVFLADFVTSGGTFNANTGTVKYRGDTAAAYRLLPAKVFNNLNIETTGTNGVDFSSSSSTVLGTLTIDSGAKMVDNAGTANTLTVVTALTNNGTFTNNDASVTSTGAFTNAGTFNGGTGTFSLQGNLVGAGTFTPQTSTFKFVGDAAQSAVGALYYNLTLSKGTETVTMSASSTVLGALTMNGAGGTLNSGTSNLTVANASTIASSNTVTTTSGILTLTGNVTSTGSIGLGTTGKVAFGGDFQNNGTLDLGTTGIATSTGVLTNASSGTINGRSGTLVLVGGLTNAGTFNKHSGTVIYHGSGVGVTELTYNNLRIRGTATLSGSTASSTVAGTFTIDPSSTLTMTNSGSSLDAVHLILLSTGSNAGTLTLAAGGSYGPTVTSTGAFTNTGTINAAGLVNFNSNFTNTSGTFNPGTSRVRYTGSASDVGNAVYYLLDFLGGATYTVTASTTAVATTTIAAGATVSLGSNTLTARGDISNSGTVATGTGAFLHPVDYVYITNPAGSQITELGAGGTFSLEVKDQNRNLDGTAIELIAASIAGNSAAGSDAETFTLIETSASSGVFRSGTLDARGGSATLGDSTLDIAATGVGTETYTDTFSGSDVGTATVDLIRASSAGSTGGGGGGGGGGGSISLIPTSVAPAPTTPAPVVPAPVVPAPAAPVVRTPAAPAPVVPAPAAPAAPAPTGDFSSRDTWVRSLGVASRSASDEARVLRGVRADAQEFRVTLTSEEQARIQLFIAYGASRETIRLGEGERRALIRDALETMRSAPTLEDLQRLTTGSNPTTRNLAEERAQLSRVRATFRTIYGHDPVFSNENENRAWNALMYRVRFPRDLAAERRGITEFRRIFRRAPAQPFQWATVRVLGYVAR